MSMSKQIIESILEAKSNRKVDMEEIVSHLREWVSSQMRQSRNMGSIPVYFEGNFRTKSAEEMGRGFECQILGSFSIRLTGGANLPVSFRSVKFHMLPLVVDLLKALDSELHFYSPFNQITYITGEAFRWQKDTTEFDFTLNTDETSGILEIEATFRSDYPRITNR